MLTKIKINRFIQSCPPGGQDDVSTSELSSQRKSNGNDFNVTLLLGRFFER